MKYTFKKLYLLLIIGLVSAITLNGQALIHMDKPYYVSGETIWYKSYFDPKVDSDGTVTIKIVDENQKLVHQSFLQINNNSISGFFKIPFEFNSGSYTMVIAGKTSLAENVRIAEVSVPIYNDISGMDLEKSQEPSVYADITFNQELKVEMALDQNPGAGDNVNAIITVTDANGNPVEANCSVSIVDQEIIGYDEGIAVTVSSIDQNYNDLTSELFYEGKVYDGGGKSIQANVIGAYSYYDNNFAFTKSDPGGSFTLPRNQFRGTREIQFIGFQNEHPEIMTRLESSVSLKSQPPMLRFNDAIEAYIEKSRMRKKINQYFKIKDKAMINDASIDDMVEVDIQARYNVNEYQDFEIMAEFAKNLMMPLRFNGKRGERSAQVINPKSQKKANYYLQGAPLFVIDGKLTRNADFAGNLPQTEVMELGIIYDGKMLREQFNVMGNSGVVVMKTAGKRITLPEEDERNIFTVNGLQPEVNYPVGYNISHEIKGMPVFDPQLYWNPSIDTDSRGQASINYVQSNDRSTYRIVVVARTGDGRTGIGYIDFDSSIAGE